MSDSVRAAIVATLLGGLVAGTIDIGAACLINWRSVPFILHAIAGGLRIGRSKVARKLPFSVPSCRSSWES
jgi:hypothetical protein